ncbi:MAG TPA: hypothetical protein VLI05_03085 [Candidatus Saccharimonadia bacterium]|nr:hypothetical protein [Candidatus Saccharimonadia bacterium]
MKPKYLQELIKNLQEFYKCPSCDTNYFFDDIRFLGEVDLYCFVQLSCHSCSLPVLATVSVNGKGPGKRKSDLRQSEEAKFAAKGAISASEIAEFHRWVSKSKSLAKRSK